LTSPAFSDKVLPMRILGIETATTTGSVAVMSTDGLIAQYTLNIEVTHSERLMATVDRVLTDARLTLADIDGLAVSIGPGSFTGLRVGLSTVKGLALATNKPVAAVPTLRALAWNSACSARSVCPLLDARKKEVYAALFRFDGKEMAQTMAETAISLEGLAVALKEETVFIGEGARLYQRELTALLGDRALFAPFSVGVPSAASVAELGIAMLAKGEAVDPDSLTPLYIRRPEAEVAWEKKQRSQ
jgi:tRNA threonylcarbamoyladenosine biosynthesis protein TsaB